MSEQASGRETGELRPISELRATGLLWLINRVVFHPRGYALALHADDSGAITGWSLQGDGSEAWSFPEEREQELFSLAESTLRRPAPERRPAPSVPREQSKAPAPCSHCRTSLAQCRAEGGLCCVVCQHRRPEDAGSDIGEAV